MRSTFVKPRCTALSSSFDTQHFRQVSNAQRFRQALMCSTFVKCRCTYATHNALQHYHSYVRRACAAHSLCLASAACKTCNDGHILCSSFCLTNYGFSSAQKSVIYVNGSHLRKISVLYIKHTRSFWGRGRGFKKKRRVFVFSQISVITDGPLLAFTDDEEVPRKIWSLHQHQPPFQS